MRAEVEQILEGEPREWEIVNVDGDAELARRYGEEIPILFVNDRLFAKVRLPRLASRLRLRRAAGLTGLRTGRRCRAKALSLYSRCPGGHSSAVERQLPKLDVAGSIPVARSNTRLARDSAQDGYARNR